LWIRTLFFSKNFYFDWLGAHAKIYNPMTTPSVDLNRGIKKKKRRRKEEEEEREKLPKIVATLVLSAGACTPLGPRLMPSVMATLLRWCTHSAWTKMHIASQYQKLLGNNIYLFIGVRCVPSHYTFTPNSRLG
jgi:hypothetical protein